MLARWVLIALFSTCLWAQPAALTNTEVKVHRANEALAAVLSQLEAASDAAWLGYSVPLLEGFEFQNCSGDSPCCCNCREAGSTQTLQLENSREAVILLRVEKGRVNRIKIATTYCSIDAGGLPVHWVEGVSPDQSVGLLVDLIQNTADEKVMKNAVMGVAIQDGEPAEQTMPAFVKSAQKTAIRRAAVFWLGVAYRASTLQLLEDVLERDPSQTVREEAVFSLYLTGRPEGQDSLLRIARFDPSRDIRKKALFWLSQLAGKQAVSALKNAVYNDPEEKVKVQAVFGLSQLPAEQGVPLLIEVARTHGSPEVRKKAIFWLGQSNDPRALNFFEQILKK